MSGLSSEIFYRDEKINVQTEDRGRGAAFVRGEGATRSCRLRDFPIDGFPDK